MLAPQVMRQSHASQDTGNDGDESSMPWFRTAASLISTVAIAGSGTNIDAVSSSRRSPKTSRYPRPMNGILVAITVMNCTFASSGRLAM